jgi:hypothetical protein
LRIPFGSKRLSQRERRPRKQAARRGAHRLVVEPHGISLALARGRSALVEPLAQHGPSPAARGFYWIFRCGIFEQIAHKT